MSFFETAPVKTMISPQDAAEIEAALPVFLQVPIRPGLGFYFEVYAATHPVFWSSLDAMYAAKIRVKGILDASEERIRSEAAQAQAFFAKWPDAVNDIVIGTSMKAHQIVHLKGLFTNVPILPPTTFDAGLMSPDQPWQVWLRTGLAAAWTGSWNMSNSASEQVNNVDIILSPGRVAQFVATIDQNWDWIEQNEPPTPAKLSALEKGDFALTTLS